MKKHREWNCTKLDPKNNNGQELDCYSDRGNMLSAFSDGSIRFSTSRDGLELDYGDKKPIRSKKYNGVQLR